MSGFLVAKRYAKGLMQFSEETNQTELVHKEMQSLKKILKESRELRQFFASPVLDAKKKQTIVKEIFKDFSKETQTFIALVIKQKREAVLSVIAEAYISLYNTSHNIQKVEVVSAMPLEAQTLDRILTKAKEVFKTDATFDVTNKIDEKLIGGFILNVEGKQIDASIRRKIVRLKKELENNDYIPKF